MRLRILVCSSYRFRLLLETRRSAYLLLYYYNISFFFIPYLLPLSTLYRIYSLYLYLIYPIIYVNTIINLLYNYLSYIIISSITFK
jgi:hypothetical protein